MPSCVYGVPVHSIVVVVGNAFRIECDHTSICGCGGPDEHPEILAAG
jgi:hypothetical protein